MWIGRQDKGVLKDKKSKIIVSTSLGGNNSKPHTCDMLE